MSSLKRFLVVGGLLILVVLALAITGGLWYLGHVRRTAPPWPARLPNVRLEPRRPILREADVRPDNAYYYIRQLAAWTNTLRVPKEYERIKACGYTPESKPILDAWFASNAAPLELCRQAAALTNCQVATALSTTQLIPHVALLLTTVKMLAARMEQSAVQQQWTPFLTDFQMAMRLSDHIGRGGPLVNRLVGLSCGSLACRTLRRMAGSTRPPMDFMRHAAKCLSTIEERLEPFSETMRYEWIFAQHMITELWQQAPDIPRQSLLGEPLGPSRWQRALSSEQQMQSHFEAIYSRLVAAADRSSGSQINLSELDAFLTDNSKLHWFVMGDVFGRRMAAFVLPAMSSAQTKYHTYPATLRGTQLFLAVCAYRQEHNGQLPRTLAELVPAYLPQLPADPFAKDGQTFRYRVGPNRWVIYSVGPDQQDDGGQYDWTLSEERARHKTDILFASDEFDKARARYLEK